MLKITTKTIIYVGDQEFDSIDEAREFAQNQNTKELQIRLDELIRQFHWELPARTQFLSNITDKKFRNKLLRLLDEYWNYTNL